MRKSLVVAVSFVALMAGSASAQAPAQAPAKDCPTLIKQVRDQVANRFDAGRHTAVNLAAEAEALHKGNKVPDCMKKVQDAAKAANLKM